MRADVTDATAGEWRRLYDDGKEEAMIELTDQQVQAWKTPKLPRRTS